jgi:hypothetical protein
MKLPTNPQPPPPQITPTLGHMTDIYPQLLLLSLLSRALLFPEAFTYQWERGINLGELLCVAPWSSENKWGRGHQVGCHHSSFSHGPIYPSKPNNMVEQCPTLCSLWPLIFTAKP